MHNNVLFLTLKVFSATGGIEKVCRVAGKSVYEMTLTRPFTAQVFCMHDKQTDADDNKYFPSEMFRGFGTRKIKFIYAAIKRARKSEVVLLSHINLLLVGWLIKKIFPSVKIVLFAHGIEVWGSLSRTRKMMINCCDEFICVSNYTKQRIIELHNIPEDKCKVLNNCLDPFLALPDQEMRDKKLLARFGFEITDKVLFTLTRISVKDRYKGYDKVMNAMVELKDKYPGIRYLIAGSYEADEKRFMDEQIKQLGLDGRVVMAGYVPDEELSAYFSLADLYIMPSMKEGFGIVFIEAMYYGLPVIAGNMDGSVDALCNGKLGILVDPYNPGEIKASIEKLLNDKAAYLPDHTLLMDQFGYEAYKYKLGKLFQ